MQSVQAKFLNLRVSGLTLGIRTAFWGLLRSEYWEFLTDVSGKPVSPIFKGFLTLEDKADSPLKMGQICCPETSVSIYHYSLRDNPQESSS
jgi:hypothetical protein